MARPVRYPAAPEAREAVNPATSSGVATRPSGFASARRLPGAQVRVVAAGESPAQVVRAAVSAEPGQADPRLDSPARWA